jgi:hypothetical protein
VDRSRRTGFETALLWWTIANVSVGLWMLLSAPVKFWGSGIAVFLPLMIALPLTFLLIWRLFSPSRPILLFGALFWALQVVTVEFPDAFYGLGLGLSVNFKLIDSTSYKFSINLIAIAAALAFVVASHERLPRQQASSEVQ